RHSKQEHGAVEHLFHPARGAQQLESCHTRDDKVHGDYGAPGVESTRSNRRGSEKRAREGRKKVGVAEAGDCASERPSGEHASDAADYPGSDERAPAKTVDTQAG